MASFTSSSNSQQWIYDVYLSFRENDACKNFVDHLYAALDQKGIHSLKRDVNSLLIPKSIEESRFAIIVFSKNYASSARCLDELAKIIECNNQIGQIVVPVFYDVDPSQVRKQTGGFGEAFAEHEDAEDDKVENWKKALVEAANISGWDVPTMANGHEYKCIQLIVEDISSKLSNINPCSVEYLVGIQPRIEKVHTLLDLESSNHVRSVGIWGMGGIGKTTIARAAFEDISNQFDGSCFLADVREISRKYGIEHLQERLLLKILNSNYIKVHNVFEGINMIKTRLQHTKVLIVLDDVDHVDQLNTLVGHQDWFGTGSRIIITTRYKHLLLSYGVDDIYDVDVLNTDKAIQLFSCNAFKKTHPAMGFERYSIRIVSYCCGLPLALKVLGSFLCGREISEWESTLERLEDIPEDEILEKLKLSFDGLNRTEKEIFLDIACFFTLKKRDNVTRILDSFGFHPVIGISVLIQKSLLLVQYSTGRLHMHDLLQELGWHIVRHISPKEAAKHSRLWKAGDILDVLAEDMGTEAVEGIVLDLPNPQEVNFSNESFKTMHRLRILKLKNACLSREFEYLPSHLRWISLHGYPSKSLPPSFQAGKLVGLKMCTSRIVQLWKGIKHLPMLRFIKLSHSHKLTQTPDFTHIPNIERLILEDCTSLVELHPSIADLDKLVVLNLKDCTSLKRLPISIQWKSLEVLTLSGCSQLKTFPEIRGNMDCLLELNLDGSAINELPSSIRHLIGLISFNLSECKNLKCLPDSICTLKYLSTLTLSGCSKLDRMPENLGHMECLEELHGNDTAIKQLPSSISLLKKLKVLNFRGCKETFESKSSSFSSWLLPRKRQECKRFVVPSLLGLHSLRKLNLSDCNLLDGELPSDLGGLSTLEELNLSGNSFISLPDCISQLFQLKVIDVVGCKKLEALPDLPLGIAKLYADDCISLKSHSDILTKCTKLLTASFTNCFELVENKQTENLADKSLRHLFQFIADPIHQETSDSRFHVHFPGREIPDWFNYQGTGYLISVKLPPYWHNEQFLGFALCGVVHNTSASFNKSSPNSRSRYQNQIPYNIDIIVILMAHNGMGINGLYTFGEMGTDIKVDSEHLCFCYIRFDKLWDSLERMLLSPNHLCQFEAYVGGTTKEASVLKKWGVRLVYLEDVKPNDQIARIQFGSVSGTSGSFEETHESLIEGGDDAIFKRKRDDDHHLGRAETGASCSSDGDILNDKKQRKS